MQDSLGIKNIGPETEEWLRKVGITSKAQFDKLGAEKTYLMLLEAGHEPDESLRHRLKGAEEELDWHIIAAREKASEQWRMLDVDEP